MEIIVISDPAELIDLQEIFGICLKLIYGILHKINQSNLIFAETFWLLNSHLTLAVMAMRSTINPFAGLELLIKKTLLI